MSDNPSGPHMVHPFDITVDDNRLVSTGMTLRDYFAGQALVLDFGSGVTPAEQARHAYNVADAMLAARTGDA